MAKEKLVNCKTCGADIAKNAKTCPHCGAKNKQRIGPGKIVLYVLAFFLVVGVINSILGDDPANDQSTQKSGQSASAKTPEEEATALLDKADSSFAAGDYKKALSYCQQVKDDYSQTEVASSVDQFISDHYAVYPNLTAKELCQQYDANQVNADNTYKDEPVIVSGKISDIGKTDITDSIYVLLDDGKNYSFVSVQCGFQKSQSDAVSQLEIGTQVRIIGTCDGEGAVVENVMLSDCIVIG